jgi:hypothetical protein
MSETPPTTAPEPATAEHSPNGTVPPSPPPVAAASGEAPLLRVLLLLGVAIGLELLTLILLFRTGRAAG